MKIYTKIGSTISDGDACIPEDMSNADRRRIADEVAAGTSQIVAYVSTKTEKKQAALAQASALGFSLQQLRVIRALVLLTSGTAAQKLKAQAILAPLIKVVVDAKIISDAIDADIVPPDFISPVIPTEDP